jgi:hypothetical protein
VGQKGDRIWREQFEVRSLKRNKSERIRGLGSRVTNSTAEDAKDAEERRGSVKVRVRLGHAGTQGKAINALQTRIYTDVHGFGPPLQPTAAYRLPTTASPIINRQSSIINPKGPPAAIKTYSRRDAGTQGKTINALQTRIHTGLHGLWLPLQPTTASPIINRQSSIINPKGYEIRVLVRAVAATAGWRFGWSMRAGRCWGARTGPGGRDD